MQATKTRIPTATHNQIVDGHASRTSSAAPTPPTIEFTVAILTRGTHDMRAVQFSRLGEPEVLEIVDVDEVGDSVEVGDRVFGRATAGPVRSATIQFARARGARVLVTASESNHDRLRALRAEPTTYGDGLGRRVHELADLPARKRLRGRAHLAGGPRQRQARPAHFLSEEHP
jgi:hypothetical protein